MFRRRIRFRSEQGNKVDKPIIFIYIILFGEEINHS